MFSEEVFSVNAEISGGFGEEAGRLGAVKLRGLSQDLPGAAEGVREVHGCQTFHSSELASQPLPEGEMREGTLALLRHRAVWIPVLWVVGCVLSRQSLNLSEQDFPNLQNGGHSHASR